MRPSWQLAVTLTVMVVGLQLLQVDASKKKSRKRKSKAHVPVPSELQEQEQGLNGTSQEFTEEQIKSMEEFQKQAAKIGAHMMELVDKGLLIFYGLGALHPSQMLDSNEAPTAPVAEESDSLKWYLLGTGVIVIVLIVVAVVGWMLFSKGNKAGAGTSEGSSKSRITSKRSTASTA